MIWGSDGLFFCFGSLAREHTCFGFVSRRRPVFTCVRPGRVLFLRACHSTCVVSFLEWCCAWKRAILTGGLTSIDRRVCVWNGLGCREQLSISLHLLCVVGPGAVGSCAQVGGTREVCGLFRPQSSFGVCVCLTAALHAREPFYSVSRLQTAFLTAAPQPLENDVYTNETFAAASLLFTNNYFVLINSTNPPTSQILTLTPIECARCKDSTRDVAVTTYRWLSEAGRAAAAAVADRYHRRRRRRDGDGDNRRSEEGSSSNDVDGGE